METKEQLQEQIKTWDGVNKYIVDDAKKKLREIDESTTITETKPKKDSFDLNGDGKVDSKDRSLAGKFLASKKGRKKKAKK
ncbi:hypothetical protein KAR91_67070 [Candidatus Pacearchaeota archaeon]|nr:hypothetical protein [Candidatus Pacearchaeota archaeon]